MDIYLPNDADLPHSADKLYDMSGGISAWDSQERPTAGRTQQENTGGTR